MLVRLFKNHMIVNFILLYYKQAAGTTPNLHILI